MQELKALEILRNKRKIYISIYNGNEYSESIDSYRSEIIVIDEAIAELEQYEQNFKQKEFDYRTQCQNVVSAARVEADAMPDRLAELEKVILDCYLVQGYQIGVGGWAFKVNISTLHKTKEIQIMFRENIYSNLETIFRTDAKTTKEMFDKAIEHFRIEESIAHAT